MEFSPGRGTASVKRARAVTGRFKAAPQATRNQQVLTVYAATSCNSDRHASKSLVEWFEIAGHQVVFKSDARTRVV